MLPPACRCYPGSLLLFVVVLILCSMLCSKIFCVWCSCFLCDKRGWRLDIRGIAVSPVVATLTECIAFYGLL